MQVSIHRVAPEDWRAFRDIRLRMLADTPLAYGETHAEAAGLGDAEWQERAARAAEQGSVGVAAVATDGSWVGLMRGFVHDVRGPVLVSVFVAPEFRGSELGVADALLDGVIAWARVRGSSLTLDVHEANPRAIAFYRRRGFVETGETHAYELPPFGDELAMRLELPPGD